MKPRRATGVALLALVSWLLAVPGAPAVASDAPSAFGRARGVQEISEQGVPPAPGSEPDTEVEPDIAVDPNDPNIVVAVVQQGRYPSGGGSVGPGFATSHDGGRRWVEGNLPGLTEATGGEFDRATDPAVAFGPDGSVYANTLPFNDGNCRNGIAVQRSDDGGLTWGDPVLAQDDLSCSFFNDKNWIAVDTFPGSPHFGRVYTAWYRSGPIVLRYSDDRGETWGPLRTVSSSGTGAIPVVQPGGDLTVVYDAFGAMRSVTSHDGGNTFDPAVTINTFQGHDPPDMRTGALPAAAIDRTTGVLYAVWQDGRFRSDGLNDTVISTSSNGGRSWSPLVRVNPDPGNSELDHFTPDVAALDGFVHVTYRTRDNEGGPSKFVGERYIHSEDGGATFEGELVLGPPTNLDYAAEAGGKFLGDYMGVTTSGRAAHAVWNVASRPPQPGAEYHQTTWSAVIRQ
ncbi:MAG: exo-alpha-sialidase [Actinobacteria bacterium]|nr:exo-alpha-sialidase [Actinomycetota bacterium]